MSVASVRTLGNQTFSSLHNSNYRKREQAWRLARGRALPSAAQYAFVEDVMNGVPPANRAGFVVVGRRDDDQVFDEREILG